MRDANPLAPRDLARTAKLMSALDSELRLQILLMLDEKDFVVHEMVKRLDKSQPLISQHLRVLKSAGLVVSRRDGREVIYSLVQPAVVDVINDIAAIAAEDELSLRRRLKRASASTEPRSGSGAAIVSPNVEIRPDEDQGLAPHTPRPRRD